LLFFKQKSYQLLPKNTPGISLGKGAILSLIFFLLQAFLELFLFRSISSAISHQLTSLRAGYYLPEFLLCKLFYQLFLKVAYHFFQR